MKKVKLTYYLVMLLALISLVSVGFASWSITDDLSTSVSGMIVVDDIMKVNDYITCDSNNLTKFGYFKSGFVSKNEDDKYVISNEGTITTSIEINVDNCKKKFDNSESLQIYLYLQSDYLSSFYNEYMEMRIELKYKDNTNPISSMQVYDNDLHSTNFNINISEKNVSNITIDVIYTFRIIDNEYFSQYVYPVLLRDNFNFVLSAKLIGEGGL